MGQIEVIAWAIYGVGAVVVCVWTWLSSARIYYLNGPPSGIWTGALWPILFGGLALWWAGHFICKVAAALSPETDQ